MSASAAGPYQIPGKNPHDSLIATDRAEGRPLWRQVKSALTAMILEHDMDEHDRLPSEAVLCEQFSVSRTVIREALAQLVNEGLIYRLQGKGAFVRNRHEVQEYATTTVGFSGELQEKHQAVARRILRQELARPTARMCRFLGIDMSEEVVVLDRVMSVDGLPRAIIHWAMPARLVPELETIALDDRSLYETIAAEYGVRLTKAERWIEAISLGDDDAALLEVPGGSAALFIESVACAASGPPIEYCTVLQLTNRARLRVAVSSP